ncbi:hypothetical protein TNIN_400621 [Trichonephila inaurata madagascariensis]|uniref:Uncharacterized protein n=1 Tax=Trichonephila inaurata madagascariensis TaxID=2747483 RepID=A0A8X7BVN6_9ARAC|nr:hypothetical protein TNIN_400621 [Trichonephila inaurata madagascariensis]
MVHCYRVTDKQKKVKCIDDFLIPDMSTSPSTDILTLRRSFKASGFPGLIICTTCARVVCLCLCEQIEAQVSWLGCHRVRVSEDNESPTSSTSPPFVDRSVNDNLKYSPTNAFRFRLKRTVAPIFGCLYPFSEIIKDRIVHHYSSLQSVSLLINHLLFPDPMA